MGFQRRARVAARYPGLDVDRLSSAKVWVYDDLIRKMDAEAVLVSGQATPQQIGVAALESTDNPETAMYAEARAILDAARQRKGF